MTGDPLTDIGQLGLRGASAVVEQMLRITQQLDSVRWPVTLFGTPEGTEDDPAPATDAATATATATTPASRAGDIRALRADADRLIELYGEWTRTLLDGFTSLAEGQPAPPTDRIELGPVAGGGEASATAYLHLFEGALAAPPAFHATDLVAHHRGAIPGSCVAVEPDPDDDGSDGGLRRALVVRVSVPEGCRPGDHHGHLLAEDLPEVLLPIVVRVVA